MNSIEKNKKLLCEYGRAVVRINSVENLLKEFLALKLVMVNDSSMNIEKAKFEAFMFGDYLKTYRDNKERCGLDDSLYNKLEELCNYRISLTHAVSTERGVVYNSTWSGTGEFILLPYKTRHGIEIPEQELTNDFLEGISSLAEETMLEIYKSMQAIYSNL